MARIKQISIADGNKAMVVLSTTTTRKRRAKNDDDKIVAASFGPKNVGQVYLSDGPSKSKKLCCNESRDVNGYQFELTARFSTNIANIGKSLFNHVFGFNRETRTIEANKPDSWMQLAIKGACKAIQNDETTMPIPINESEKQQQQPIPIIDLTSEEDDNDEVGFILKDDLKILVDGRKISVNKSLIQLKFTKLDTILLAEAAELSIKDFSYNVVKAAVAFCYDHPLPNINVEEMLALMEFANHYGINNLKDKVELILADKLGDSNRMDAAKTLTNAREIKRDCSN